ncbi:MFS transporter [Candidatus Methylomirabilis lanthanidiphila]|uniref:MFS transporter n=1 Tax=Candidatus Methylomirabilis lanthanidiphila TaxID=2211376 RepID=A0A564ZJ81_9BACT|nr:MFS transporter [Candidatus Methylomirabilis lanthanidiphila]VUZ84702.1 MFS transporter [Candidatus Methylomirabilis lanthanidiphila]
MSASRPTDSGSEGVRRFGLSRNVVALGLVSMLTDVSSEMIYPLLPLFLTSVLGAGQTFVGLVEGIAESAASVTKLLSGWLSDRLGRRKELVVVGYTLSTLARPVVALALAPWHVLMVRFADRLGKGLRTPPRDALIAASTDMAIRGRAYGFHRSMDHLGAVGGPALAYALLLLLGDRLRTLFLLAAIPGILSVLILMLRVREAQVGPVAAATEPRRAGRLDSQLTRFLLVVTLFTLGNSSDAFLLLRAQEVGIAAIHLPLLWMFFSLVKAATGLPGGMLSDLRGRRGGIIAGWLVYALAYLGFGAAGQPWHIWVLLGFYGLYFGLTEGGERALIADLVPPDRQASAFGLFHACIGIAALPSSLLMGYLYQTFGAGPAFTVGAVLAGLAALLLLLLLRPPSSST